MAKKPPIDHVILMGDSESRLRNTVRRGIDRTWIIVPAVFDIQPGESIWFYERGAGQGQLAKFVGLAESVNSGEQGLQRGYAVVGMRISAVTEGEGKQS